MKCTGLLPGAAKGVLSALTRGAKTSGPLTHGRHRYLVRMHRHRDREKR